MNIAVVGCGLMAESHVKALRSLGYKVVFVIGRNSDRTKAFAKKYNILSWSLNLEEVLDNFELDSIHICTPPANHYETIKTALKNKINVICEKPFVLDKIEAKELVELAEKQGVVNAIGFNVRFYESIINAQKSISDGNLGKINLVNGTYKQEFHVLPAPYSWRYDAVQAGKMRATTEIGSHWIDLMGYLTKKKVEAVSATFSSFQPQRKLQDGIMYPASSNELGNIIKVDSEDCAIITFKLEGGALGNVVLSEVSHGRSNYLNIEVDGSDGAFWWDSETLNHSHYANDIGQGFNTEVLAFAGGFTDSLASMLCNIYDVIEKKEPNKSAKYATFQDGLINIKICNAIYESAHNKSAWVSIN
jgi:predicted dehydrogenase